MGREFHGTKQDGVDNSVGVGGHVNRAYLNPKFPRKRVIDNGWSGHRGRGTGQGDVAKQKELVSL